MEWGEGKKKTELMQFSMFIALKPLIIDREGKVSGDFLRIR